MRLFLGHSIDESDPCLFTNCPVSTLNQSRRPTQQDPPHQHPNLIVSELFLLLCITLNGVGGCTLNLHSVEDRPCEGVCKALAGGGDSPGSM